MLCGFTSFPDFIKPLLIGLIIMILCGFSGIGQDMPGMPGMKKDSSSVSNDNVENMHAKMDMPMAFFTHMGIPLDVGSYSLRAAGLLNRDNGITKSDFNFQFETGLSKTVGLFLGGDKLIEDPNLEVMFQFLVLQSKNRMCGFSPIIEFEFHLGDDAPRLFYTLVGISGTQSTSRFACNQVLHYSPLEDLVEGSVSIVVKASKRIFFVSELSGVAGKSMRPVINLLCGIKIKINDNFLLGLAYQFPLTENRDYSSQYIFQPNVMLGK
jgi:hypothetical protein